MATRAQPVDAEENEEERGQPPAIDCWVPARARWGGGWSGRLRHAGGIVATGADDEAEPRSPATQPQRDFDGTSRMRRVWDDIGADRLGNADLDGMRVLAACDNYTPASSGGAEKAAHEIYVRLARAGAHLRVVSVPHGTPYDDPGVDVVTARGIDLSKFVGGYLAFSPDTFITATQEFRNFRPHVLHGNTIHYNSSIALARLSARFQIPYVLTAQLGPLDEMPFMARTAANLYDRAVGRYIVRRATKVLAVSSAVRAHMISIGAPADRVEVVENGVEHERFACPPLGLNDQPLVLSIGRIVENKGPQLLVDAAIRLHQEGLPVRVGFLGDGPLRSELEQRVEQAGLSGSIVFHGQVQDVERWLRRADIVVRPSFTEGLPLAVLEAMSAGRCNVVSDIAPNLELITDSVNGLTFRTGDASDLAAKLRLAITDQQARVRMASEGRRSSLNRSWDRMAAETGLALSECIGQRGCAT